MERQGFQDGLYGKAGDAVAAGVKIKVGFQGDFLGVPEVYHVQISLGMEQAVRHGFFLAVAFDGHPQQNAEFFNHVRSGTFAAGFVHTLPANHVQSVIKEVGVDLHLQRIQLGAFLGQLQLLLPGLRLVHAVQQGEHILDHFVKFAA